MKNIPLFKVLMTDTACANAQKVLQSGYVSQGPWVEQFEGLLQRVCGGARAVVTVNSGTSALDLALHLAGVKAGDYVISTPMTCTATNSVIVNRGAKILWADVDTDGLIAEYSVKWLMSTFGDKVRAIMAVDWGGALPKYSDLKRYGVPVIEDAAHRFPSGCSKDLHGDYVCYSFQAIKFLTTGDGGALLVPWHQQERAKKLRWFGLDRGESSRSQQSISESGYKYHMNDIAAAIGIGNFYAAQGNVRTHRTHAEIYTELLGEEKELLGEEKVLSHHWIYTIRHSHRDALREHLLKNGVESAVVHDRNDKHPAFREHASAPFALDNTREYAQEQLSIPVGWWLTEKDVHCIAKLIKRFRP